MLTEFDQNTIAKMTAALEYVCRKIPAGKDSHLLRKRIASELIDRARAGTCTLGEFQKAGIRILDEITKPPRFNWFGWRRASGAK